MARGYRKHNSAKNDVPYSRKGKNKKKAMDVDGYFDHPERHSSNCTCGRC